MYLYLLLACGMNEQRMNVPFTMHPSCRLLSVQSLPYHNEIARRTPPRPWLHSGVKHLARAAVNHRYLYAPKRQKVCVCNRRQLCASMQAVTEEWIGRITTEEQRFVRPIVNPVTIHLLCDPVFLFKLSTDARQSRA